jgi:hypothetical protein
MLLEGSTTFMGLGPCMFRSTHDSGGCWLSDSRPSSSFVYLCRTFKRFCQVPTYFLALRLACSCVLHLVDTWLGALLLHRGRHLARHNGCEVLSLPRLPSR